MANTLEGSRGTSQQRHDAANTSANAKWLQLNWIQHYKNLSEAKKGKGPSGPGAQGVHLMNTAPYYTKCASFTAVAGNPNGARCLEVLPDADAHTCSKQCAHKIKVGGRCPLIFPIQMPKDTCSDFAANGWCSRLGSCGFQHYRAYEAEKKASWYTVHYDPGWVAAGSGISYDKYVELNSEVWDKRNQAKDDRDERLHDQARMAAGRAAATTTIRTAGNIKSAKEALSLFDGLAGPQAYAKKNRKTQPSAAKKQPKKDN
jgi:hypothetical protein